MSEKVINTGSIYFNGVKIGDFNGIDVSFKSNAPKVPARKSANTPREQEHDTFKKMSNGTWVKV